MALSRTHGDLVDRGDFVDPWRPREDRNRESESEKGPPGGIPPVRSMVGSSPYRHPETTEPPTPFTRTSGKSSISDVTGTGDRDSGLPGFGITGTTRETDQRDLTPRNREKLHGGNLVSR